MAAELSPECPEGAAVQVGGRSKEYQTIFTQVSTGSDLRGLATWLEVQDSDCSNQYGASET